MRNNNNDKSYVNFPRNFRYDWAKKNGKPTGIAQVYTSNNQCVYQGPIKNRKPHGKEGKWFYNNGVLRYDGNWKDGKKDGKGKAFAVDGGLCYDGNWKNGKKDGKGKCYYDNGVLGYDGNWKNGKMDGKGKCYYDNGVLRYDGNWKDGKRNGKGKSFAVDGGLCYDGNWKDGKKDGKGKYYNDGDLLYDGNWKDGKMDGMVKVYNQDGLIRTKEIWKEGNFQRLCSFGNAPCISGVFINADQRYELSKKDKKTFMNRKREREVREGDLEIDNSSSQSSLKDTNKHDKTKGF